MSPTRNLNVKASLAKVSHEPTHYPIHVLASHTGNHDPVVMLARLACHLDKEGRSEILGMALAMEVL